MLHIHPHGWHYLRDLGRRSSLLRLFLVRGCAFLGCGLDSSLPQQPKPLSSKEGPFQRAPVRLLPQEPARPILPTAIFVVAFPPRLSATYNSVRERRRGDRLGPPDHPCTTMRTRSGTRTRSCQWARRTYSRTSRCARATGPPHSAPRTRRKTFGGDPLPLLYNLPHRLFAGAKARPHASDDRLRELLQTDLGS